MGSKAGRIWRATKTAGRVLCWIVAFFGAALVGASFWISDTFGPITVDQMLTNLAGGGEGVPEGYISSFVVLVVLLPLLAMPTAWICIRIAKRRRRLNARSYDRPVTGGNKPAIVPATKSSVVTSAAASEAARAPHRMRAWWRRSRTAWARGLAATAVLAIGALLFAQTISLASYLRSITTDLTLDAYYVDPVATLEGDPRNLIVIYLESMENAFGDESVVEKNVLAPVQEATEGWEAFDELLQYDGGGWTMAGIVGTQCGVPLRGTTTVVAGDQNEIGADDGLYMPGATCLGDVLGAAGYTNVFMGGADASFASKGSFLRTHGFDEVYDLPYWHDLGDASENEWGISDGTLFAHAREEVDRLHESGQPFNLTMLTLDSHEAVYLQSYCEIDTEVAMTSVAECSMEQVAEFVDYLDDRGYLEDTVVVLMGDHEKFVSARSDYAAFAELDQRTIFNRVWSPDALQFTRESIDQLSMFATMLQLAGFDVEGYRAGVGVSAFLPEGQRAGILDLSPAQYRDVVESRSNDLYTKLWGRAADAGFSDVTEHGSGVSSASGSSPSALSSPRD